MARTVNPYKAAAKNGAFRTVEDSHELSYELSAIDNEYTGHDESFDCLRGCGGSVFYKSTIGAYKCTNCGGLETHNGKLIGK